MYKKLPKNTSQIDQIMCKQFKRTGHFCGQCETGYSLPVYSYVSNCVKCSSQVNIREWAKYFAITLLPTTVFFFIVLLFRFRATSPHLNVYILICQLITSPHVLRSVAKHTPYYILSTRQKYLNGFFITIASVWNLDYFRLVYTPFCLHPQASILKVLSLDYITALYPLVLIIFTYTLVTLHYRGCPLLLWLWRPFREGFARLRRQWDIHNSLVDAFATFLLLSYGVFQLTFLCQLFHWMNVETDNLQCSIMMELLSTLERNTCHLLLWLL